MNKLLLLFISIGFLCSFQSESNSQIVNPQAHIIPKPDSIALLEGSFTWDTSETLYADSIGLLAQEFLIPYLAKANMEIEVSEKQNATIQILYKEQIPSEGYVLEINQELILIQASDAAGAFYGVQSLRQLLPVTAERISSLTLTPFTIPSLRITDAPKFEYRGMHLDVARHFFDVAAVKSYIDILAMLKMNRFHWHLTEDQGWRIEIKKYPKLQTHAAYRDQTLVGHYSDTPQIFDGKKYGGYYTQEEIKEVVAYAASLNITVVPEIEMPGHAQAAISAYPNLGCTGQPIKVAQKWGVFEDIYCPKPETFQFLKDVLDEVIPLFPGEYIHIGGDEAPKTRWNSCDHCQKLIAQENLEDAHGLQSYFISQIEEYLNSKGKQIIGWDEILEGGLAPNATVMSWRGTAGAVQAAKEGHNVILTPTSHAYFDYYQDTSPDEPLAIGGFLPLKKVYSFSPFPPEMDDESKKYVLGAQGNIWTEYIPTQEKLQYMAYPRTMAMSEVVWSGPTEDLDVDYSDFLTRLDLLLKRLDVMGVNYANHLNNLEGKVVKQNDSLFYSLRATLDSKKIGYRLNGGPQTNYSAPFYIDSPTTIAANVIQADSIIGPTFTSRIVPHKGTKAQITVDKTPHPSYSTGGINALNDGVNGSDNRYGDDQWLGFWGDDLEIILRFNKPTKVDSISMQFYHAPGQWIYSPQEVQIGGVSVDGYLSTAGFTSAKTKTLNTVTLIMNNKVYSELRIRVPNYGVIQEGAQGAGNKAWTFIDEIIID
ncbi:MAG: beta-N-acetylhexosaminidase [Gilvibacter sp.]